MLPAVLNFFLPGLGYIVSGQRNPLGFLWLAGVIGLTIVEFGIRTSEPGLYWLMFISVLVMNTAFAIDAYRGAQEA
jgi:hypothetical protein